jgi:hypothetical protein
MYTIIRTEQEIDDLLNQASESADNSKYPGMSFEQGIEYAIKWLTEKDAVHPFE